MSSLTIRNLGVRYGSATHGFPALQDVGLDVPKGMFVTLLGPSGSGKTTLLRCIAGLVTPTVGRIEAGGRLFYDATTKTGLPTRERNLGMVFQAFALWPHMTVADNVGFPLRLRRWSRDQRQRRVAELLDLVGLPGLGARYPGQLSGGQQQRVGIARAISCEPSLLLMDEPLSGLDARLREEMRSYIRRLQKELGITVVYVTHDREEALGLSDVTVILSGGRIVSVGPPRGLYCDPQDSFTASFLAGWSLLGNVDELRACEEGRWLYEAAPHIGSRGTRRSMVVLPMEIPQPLAEMKGTANGHVAAEVMNVEFLGTSVRTELRLPGVQHTVFISQTGIAGQSAMKLSSGARVGLPLSAFRILPEPQSIVAGERCSQ